MCSLRSIVDKPIGVLFLGACIVAGSLSQSAFTTADTRDLVCGNSAALPFYEQRCRQALTLLGPSLAAAGRDATQSTYRQLKQTFEPRLNKYERPLCGTVASMHGIFIRTPFADMPLGFLQTQRQLLRVKYAIQAVDDALDGVAH